MNARVALVTGAARGQGLAVVRRLLEDGYAIVAGDVLVDDLHAAVAEIDSEQVLPIALDVAEEQQWADAMAATAERFGGLDVLVNNAGILRREFLVDETVEGFERLWRVNTLGVFLGIRAAVPLLKQGTSPAVVNTLSTSGIRAFDKHVAYNSSKWAARGVSMTAAVELAEYGIRVNAVLPGPIATPMHDSATIERLSSAPLLGRAGTAEDIAEIVADLASAKHSFLTGAEIVVDGGHSLRITH